MGRRARMLCEESIGVSGFRGRVCVTGRVCGEGTRTGVDCSYVLERVEHQHEHDPHAEDLDTASGHVQHESLHRKRFGG
jgi:hypothetical protein